MMQFTYSFPELEDELRADFIHLFNENDRLAATLIYDEKPLVCIKLDRREISRFMLGTAPDTKAYHLTAVGFDDDFYLESGVSLDDAMDFCEHFGFQFKIQL